MQPFTVFISYRRQDTAPIALLLKNEIEKRLQFVRVSVDVEEMKSGDVFPERLRQLIDGAHATIVLVGKHWMPRRGEKERAPSVDKDWVAEEIVYSHSAPIALPEVDRLGLARREINPLFADCERGFAQFDLPAQIESCRHCMPSTSTTQGGRAPSVRSSIGWRSSSCSRSVRTPTRIPNPISPRPDAATCRRGARPDPSLRRLRGLVHRQPRQRRRHVPGQDLQVPSLQQPRSLHEHGREGGGEAARRLGPRSRSACSPMRDLDDVFGALARSPFRRRFALGAKDRQYLADKGRAVVIDHAREFIAQRLTPAAPRHDGKQTPFRGHPVFVAQHATATCCRGCLAKWHGIAAGRPLSADEQAHAVAAIARWLDAQADGIRAPRTPRAARPDRE
jgi:hypothetical protein